MKKIANLEEELSLSRNQCTDQERLLGTLKAKLLHYKPATKKSTSNINRRRTWANGNVKNAFDAEEETAKVNNDSMNQSTKFNGFGHAMEYTDEEFETFLNASLLTDQIPEENLRPPSPPSTIKRLESSRARRSLLKTPKSLRNLMKKDHLQVTPTTSLIAASPMAVDKDKRIKALEEELEELKHFHQTETALRSTDLAKIKRYITYSSAKYSCRIPFDFQIKFAF